jgi:hypothetical protein
MFYGRSDPSVAVVMEIPEVVAVKGLKIAEKRVAETKHQKMSRELRLAVALSLLGGCRSEGFSSSGRLLQVEYATKAAQRGGLVLGLEASDGCLLAVRRKYMRESVCECERACTRAREREREPVPVSASASVVRVRLEVV